VSAVAWDQAVERGDVAAVRRLLAAGLDVDARDAHGQTALMRAAHHGHLPLVEALIAAGADLDVTAKYRLSALTLAIVAGHAGVARALARAGADLALIGSGAPGFAGKSAYDLAAGRGDMDDLLPELRPGWHALLGPLPDGATPRRQPVASPAVQATPEGVAIAGWEQLTVELTAGAAGLRHVMVVLDAGEQPISASDTVLYCREVRGSDEIAYHQETLGGRLEPDGTFRSTRWRSEAVGPVDRDELPWTSTPSQPTPQEIERLGALVIEVMRRRPPR
jgi:uncharacterized protein